jgi:hypothetical protein
VLTQISGVEINPKDLLTRAQTYTAEGGCIYVCDLNALWLMLTIVSLLCEYLGCDRRGRLHQSGLSILCSYPVFDEAVKDHGDTVRHLVYAEFRKLRTQHVDIHTLH